MSLKFGTREINNVEVVDDSPSARESLRYHLEELPVEANEVAGNITDVDSFIKTFDRTHSAVICDYNLTPKNYSKLNGDEIVSGLYKLSVPAVLCTKFHKYLPEPIRRRRRFIPVIIVPEDVEGAKLVSAFETCVSEFNGQFTAVRKPWRTVIRIEGGTLSDSAQYVQVNAVIPEWDSSSFIAFEWKIDQNRALQKVRDGILNGDVVRIFATVNVGANETNDLYVDEWSLGRIYER
jgi:CheY-like chemotaxis protein